MLRFLTACAVFVLLVGAFYYTSIEVVALIAIVLASVAAFYMTRGKVAAEPIYSSSVRLGKDYSFQAIVCAIVLMWVVANFGSYAYNGAVISHAWAIENIPLGTISSVK